MCMGQGVGSHPRTPTTILNHLLYMARATRYAGARGVRGVTTTGQQRPIQPVCNGLGEPDRPTDLNSGCRGTPPATLDDTPSIRGPWAAVLLQTHAYLTDSVIILVLCAIYSCNEPNTLMFRNPLHIMYLHHLLALCIFLTYVYPDYTANSKLIFGVPAARPAMAGLGLRVIQ